MVFKEDGQGKRLASSAYTAQWHVLSRVLLSLVEITVRYCTDICCVYTEYAQVTKMLGNGRLEAQCFDGEKRLAHIRGKMRKKV